jgi:hypothetical protein
MNAFPSLKYVQTLYEARFESGEQVYPLAQLQIPIVSHVINFGTDLNLNLPWILKGLKPCGKNMVHSPGYMELTFAKYTTIMIAELVVTCDLGSSLE